MSKKKKKRQAVIAPSAEKKPKRGIAVVAIVAVLLIAAVAGRRMLFLDPHKRILIASFSNIDLTGMEPQVAQKIRRLEEDVRKNPNSASVWGKLGMNLDAHDLEKESVPVYKEAASLDASDFHWSYFCAIALSKMGSIESLDWFARAQKIRPIYIPLLVAYGDALFHFGKMDQAAKIYQDAASQDAKCAQAYFGLAQIDFVKGQMQDSRANLQKAFEANPSYGEAYSLLASICRRLNDAPCVAQASAFATRMPDKNFVPDPVYAELTAEGESSLWHRFRGSEYLKKQLYDQAIQEFQQALRLRPNAEGHEDLAKAFNSAGKFQEASAEYQTAISMHPTALNYHALGLTYAKMGRYAEAEQMFEKAIGLKPDFAEAYFNLAVVDAKTNRADAAIENLKQAIDIKPDYAEAHYYLGLAYNQTNNQTAAMQEYKILMRQNPEAASRLLRLIEEKKASKIAE